MLRFFQKLNFLKTKEQFYKKYVTENWVKNLLIFWHWIVGYYFDESIALSFLQNHNDSKKKNNLSLTLKKIRTFLGSTKPS